MTDYIHVLHQHGSFYKIIVKLHSWCSFPNSLFFATRIGWEFSYLRGTDNVPSSVSLSIFKYMAVQCAQPSGLKEAFEKKHN